MRKLNFRPFAGRRLTAMLLVIVGAAVFTIKLVSVQVVSAPELNAQAFERRGVPVTIPSVRGDIVDREGVVMATTDERYDVQLSPKNVRLNGGKFWRTTNDGGVATVQVSAEEAFAEIAAITGQTPEEIATIVDDALKENPKSDFAYVKRAVDLTTLNALKELSIPWMTFSTNHQRTYPNGAVAGNIVGFSGADGEPLAGVELSQDACLSGVNGEEVFERGADGVKLPGSQVVTQPAVNGGTVQLTIDRDLQYEAQQAINNEVTKTGAEWGFITIMNAKTGELLAVAEDYSVDPNDVDSTSPERREARSFTSPYEPGSSFKTLTASALIDQGAANPLTQNLTPDHLEPEPNVAFSDYFRHNPLPFTLTGILVKSSNVGISMLGSRLDEQTRHNYLTKFGVGQPTNAGMPAESSGVLHDVADWDRQTSYNTMFGQGLSATIIQTASAYQAIANDGVRIPPSIVKGCEKADGTFEKHDAGEPVRVLSSESAASTRHMLEAVTQQDWIIQPLSISGYRLGGKTATAEQTNGQGGYRSDYVYSFAGMFPMDDPQFVIVASVAFPKAGVGAVIATRTWNAAAKATIRSFHVPPSSGVYDPLPEQY